MRPARCLTGEPASIHSSIRRSRPTTPKRSRPVFQGFAVQICHAARPSGSIGAIPQHSESARASSRRRARRPRIRVACSSIARRPSTQSRVHIHVVAIAHAATCMPGGTTLFVDVEAVSVACGAQFRLGRLQQVHMFRAKKQTRGQRSIELHQILGSRVATSVRPAPNRVHEAVITKERLALRIE